jgi:hypothetical protein
MKGTITIELTTTTPASGSGIPDLGHVAYQLKKTLPQLEFKNANGKPGPLSREYKITKVVIETE